METSDDISSDKKLAWNLIKVHAPDGVNFEGEGPDGVILVQHESTLEELKPLADYLDECGFFTVTDEDGQELHKGITPITRAEFERFNRLENDFGTLEMAKLAADILYREHNIRVAVIQCLVPRGFADVNRLDPKVLTHEQQRDLERDHSSPVKNTFNLARNNDLYQFALGLVNQSQNQVTELLTQWKGTLKFIYDLHSMWDGNLRPEIKHHTVLNPHTVNTFTDSTADPQNWQDELREIDVFAGSGLTEEHQARVVRHLNAKGYQTHRNRPYAFSKITFSYLITQLVAELGIPYHFIVDICKRYLGKIDVSDAKACHHRDQIPDDYDVTNLERDPGKIESVTRAGIVNVIVEIDKSKSSS